VSLLKPTPSMPKTWIFKLDFTAVSYIVAAVTGAASCSPTENKEKIKRIFGE